MKRLFVDTSAWYAFVNRRDPNYEAVAGTLRRRDVRFVTTSYVFDETVTLVNYRLGHRVACTAGGVLRNPAAADLVQVSAADEQAAWQLFTERADKQYSFTDCTSFVVMRRLGLTAALAIDDDFRREGFQILP